MSARPAVAAALVAGLLLLAACAPEPGEVPPSPENPSSPSAPAASGSPTPSPTATAVALPTDCRAILSQAVLAQLGPTPLNDPGLGIATGVQPDGSLVCAWRDPAADTTGLITEITRMSRGPALGMLNGLASSDGFSCFTPNGGTRCEKVWDDATYPVKNGRTLFWRDDILIDTRWSNLAPIGYTDSIVSHLFGG
ncbi:hypothetical protein [Microbacterium sp. 10M-3C3]|jgi:hypothetical protein|uniref:hypothetical protein n=1 Tax=Microbacterium sp. 10M-3C3 TaxID=2483401 RepID=UPI000F64189B|nr:hypothetical protein [Microbacterium sp. 10M-3C3]